MLRRGACAPRRRALRGHVHRLDRARRPDRGAHTAREPSRVPPRRAGARDAPCTRDLRARPALRRARVARAGTRRHNLTLPGSVRRVDDGRILPQADLERYADAVVKASLRVAKGDTLAVYGHPAHREFLVEIV